MRTVDSEILDAPDAIRVAIVEDRGEIRDAVGILIDETEGLRLSGSYGSAEVAIAALRREPPDLLLMDIGLPGMDGIEAVRRLKDRWPQLPILMFTVYADDDRIFNALCAGASGYLLKKTPATGLVQCIRDAVAGGAPMSPDVARKVVDLFRTFRPPAPPVDLTPHEIRVLGLIAQGESYKSAGAKLGVSASTVSFHLRKIYEKLHVHSKSEAVARALRAGALR